MKNFEVILKSFSIRDTLNPKVWENPEDPEKASMKKKVKDALEKIADEFIEYLGEDVFVEDVVLTGSLANFNWSEFSDFDLHVIVDFQQYEGEAELYKELYNLKKQIFNEKHNIKIFGYDVELYAQDVEESHFSSGTYSIMDDEWIKKPKKIKENIDKSLLITKISQWVEKIDKAIRNKDEDKNRLEDLKTKLKEYRKSGLEKDGELSYENLVFKFLRRSGHIQKLFDSINKQTDKELSVERTLEEDVKDKKSIDSGSLSQLIQSLDNSQMLSSLKKLSLLGKTYEETPGMKIPFSKDVEIIQDGLEFLGFKLPNWGVDGKFGPETKSAVEKFQQSSGLNVDGVMKPKDIQYLLAYLLIGKFSESKKSPVQGTSGKKGDFTYLDLNTSDGFRLYAEICQNFIESRNSNAGVTGQMMAECAKRNFSKGYVPPELALAQLALEGGLSSDPSVRPRKTKNPFNVGNTDSGKNKFFSTVQEGVCAYYDLMTRKYLTGGKTPEDLLGNFVNDKGYRYASGNYEPKLRKIVAGASKISEPLIAKYGSSTSTMV